MIKGELRYVPEVVTIKTHDNKSIICYIIETNDGRCKVEVALHVKSRSNEYFSIVIRGRIRSEIFNSKREARDYVEYIENVISLHRKRVQRKMAFCVKDLRELSKHAYFGRLFPGGKFDLDLLSRHIQRFERYYVKENGRYILV